MAGITELQNRRVMKDIMYQLDRAKLDKIYDDRDNYYSLLVDRKNKILVLEAVITSIGWYSVYFWLSAEEYRLFREDKPAFDQLVGSYASDKGARFYKERLLRNEGPGGDRYTRNEPIPIEGL